MDFMQDLADRVEDDRRVQLTTDRLSFYVQAVESAFAGNADFAELIKHCGPPEGPQRRYSPAECTGTEVRQISGNPDHITTSYVERQNLTMRMYMRRFTRLTNSFSKKLTNHMHMASLYSVFYNFLKVHKALRVTPAMEAGISNELRDFEWLVEMIDSKGPPLKKPGLYKKKSVLVCSVLINH